MWSQDGQQEPKTPPTSPKQRSKDLPHVSLAVNGKQGKHGQSVELWSQKPWP